MKKTAIIFLALLLLYTAYLWQDYHNQPTEEWRRSPEEARIITIEQGSSLREISSLLRSEGVIRSEYLFKGYVYLKGKQADLQAGSYRFAREVKVDEIAHKISSGKVADEQITIPEGFTLEQIAHRVSEHLPIEAEEFLDTIENNDWNREYLPDRENVEWKLEGYLYPSTYNVHYNISPEDLITIMLNRFENEWLEKLRQSYLQNENDLTVNELVTIASMVEREAKLIEEKPLIAGVIYNRLENEMKLQIDASVQYALPERKERLLYRDLEIESDYNTYLNFGLPPGPIANPGGNSLQAVLEPEESDYLFYFARPDGSHVFTESYQEHLRQQRILTD